MRSKGRVVELADTSGSDPDGPKNLWGFDSLRAHHSLEISESISKRDVAGATPAGSTSLTTTTAGVVP